MVYYYAIEVIFPGAKFIDLPDISLMECAAEKAATSSEKQRLVPVISVYGIKRREELSLIVREKDKLRLVPFISVTGIKRREEQS
jgi:hypothetical protein